MDRALKNQVGSDLLNQLRNDNNIEESLRNKEQHDMQQKINQHHMGEQMAKIKDLEKKAAQAKEMRDYMAYKQFQKDLERERAMKDKMEFHRQVDDTNRKRDEKERQWRKFYEDFAH